MRPGQTHIETVRDLETIMPGGIIRHDSPLNGPEAAIHLGNDVWAVTGSLATIDPPDWIGADIMTCYSTAAIAARIADNATHQHTIKGETS